MGCNGDYRTNSRSGLIHSWLDPPQLTSQTTPDHEMFSSPLALQCLSSENTADTDEGNTPLGLTADFGVQSSLRGIQILSGCLPTKEVLWTVSRLRIHGRDMMQDVLAIES